MVPSRDAAMARAMKMKKRDFTALSPEQAGRPERQRQQQKAEGDGRRPGWAVEGRSDALDDPEQHRAKHRARQAAQSAEHADREYAADVFAPDGGLDRLDDDEERAGKRSGRDRDAERGTLDADRVRRHQRKRLLILRDRHDGAPDE